jgi:RNA polymerase sigma factor (sigma-70 family)
VSGAEGSSSDLTQVRRMQRKFLEAVMDPLLKFALYETSNNRPNAEDICQEALTKILRSYDWVSGRQPTLAYAKKAVRSVKWDAWRKKKRRLQEVFATDEVLDAVPATRLVEEAILNTALYEAVESLPTRHRRLVKAHYFKGLTLPEFAEREKLAIGTVYNYHQQALDQLKQQLNPQKVKVVTVKF